ncbi:MAG: 16S rRNA (cytosine(1402)-N(4))-methyltransferase RsmH [candidate division WOR-3 bacterium]|nr:16S rRNA (cytosine(1402)-N(4))-methyltransferase RsmH [candidate division WOR-3 bacterium]
MEEKTLHRPIMVDEVIKFLIQKEDGLYIDATLGCGGHSLAILSSSRNSVIGIDLDPDQIRIATERLSNFMERFLPVQANYRFIDQFITKKVDGVLFDLGYSSYQLDNPVRGFSYRENGPLDMRYGKHGITAYDLIENRNQDEIADLIYHYGGEHNSRRIARKIKEKKPRTTGELAILVRKSFPRKKGHKHLGRIFQALRIAVNQEMENIEEGIIGASKILKKKGRLVIVSYHSEEEKLICRKARELELKSLTKRVVKPDRIEFQENPRCRSAHLRAFEK